jgi:hypothetical protein
MKELHDSVRVVREKNIVVSPAGPGTKNGCAGERRQKFTRNQDKMEALKLGNIGLN